MSRYVRFMAGGKPRWGRVNGAIVQPVGGDPIHEAARDEGAERALTSLTLLPPVTPTKIVCVGRNYRAHAAELGNDVPREPLLFLKPPSCLLAPGAAIVTPTGQSELVHHEGELGVVMGRRARHVGVEEALDHVFGYVPFNDVTARDLQRRDVQFTRAKSFDTFGPAGPWIETDFTPDDQQLTVTVNDDVRQQGRLSQMVFDVSALIAAISRIMTLEPGDLIATGTPSGVGPLVDGDVVRVTIDGLGALSNTVRAE